MLNGENVDTRFFKLLRNIHVRHMDIRVFVVSLAMKIMLKNLMICLGIFPPLFLSLC